MRFDLEDKKKISLLCDLLKAFMSGKSNVLFVWHRNEGWAVLQNQEYLDNLDCSNMVNLCHIKSHFFSHMAHESRDFLCFELDVTNYVRVLKSIKKQIKRMVWHIYDIDETENKAKLQLSLMVEDGQMEVQKDIFLQMRMNPQFYFRIFRDFIEDKTQYLEIKQVYMKQMKDLKKNECVYFKFYNDYVSAYNQEEENNISIRKTALEKYDYNSLIQNLGGKNRLTIPPNFLIPQIMMGIKIKDPIQLFISNDIVDDHISVSLRTKNDSFTFISQFKSIMERDEEDFKQNPFEIQKQQQIQVQQQQQLLPVHPNSEDASFAGHSNYANNHQYGRAVPNPNDSQFMENQHQNRNIRVQQKQQYQSDSGFQNPLNSYGSVQSHIQGLTNQMHLIDNYQGQTPSMEAEEVTINKHQTNIRSNDDVQQQFKKPQIIYANHNNNKKKFNINQEHERVQQQPQNNNFGNLNNSFAQSNQIMSVVSSQQSNSNFGNFMGNELDNSILNKRRNDQMNNNTDFSNLSYFRENATKRIKESNYAESHQLPQNNFTRIPTNTNAALQQQQQQYQQQQQQQLQQQQQQQYPHPIRNGYINPLVSQDKAENSFSNFINQNKKDSEFSIFKSNTRTSGASFQPQKNQQGNNSRGNASTSSTSDLFVGTNQNAKPKSKINVNIF